MPASIDGPNTDLFKPLALRGNIQLPRLGRGVSKQMRASVKHAPTGRCVCWGIPFRIGKVLLARDKPVTIRLTGARARWLVLMHTADAKSPEPDADGFISPMRGSGRLGEHAANYVFLYADGSEKRVAIRRRFQIGAFSRRWGENCFQAVAHRKPAPSRSHPDETIPIRQWGFSQYRAGSRDGGPWVNWLWAWKNPHPGRAIVGVRIEPAGEPVLLSAISVGKASAHPLRWAARRKAILTLPKGTKFDPLLDDRGQYRHVRLDMGQVISIAPGPVYPDAAWSRSYNNKPPEVSEREVLVEYTAHADARFHLPGGRTVPIARVQAAAKAGPLVRIAPATQRVTLRAVEKAGRKPVAVKLHVHGAAGEYLPPVDRHHVPNAGWFQDYSVDFTHRGLHHCAYIDGETRIDLPLGKVYVEVSKGFEIRPIRKAFRITRATREIVVEIDRVLPWRQRNWVSADTHVHFLSPTSALLEGAGEGVNVVNLLASQWGELMTNVGDFDGRTTHGSKASGGDGEHLVRVGTENRQHVLGHISLLGYRGGIIAPMTTGGPDESALGDPVGILLAQWAAQCKAQGGLVILPHFPNPRAENPVAILSGDVDGIEMTSWGDLYGGIDPYSLSDYYRYLNCGYLVAAVGGTDKMSAATAVGTVRTYARIDPDREFDYGAWMDAVRRAHTFVTYGPLMEFAVDGLPPGSQIHMTASGGTVDVTWQVASVTVPMSRVQLVVNGEVRQDRSVRPDADEGHWSVRLDRSSWLALLVRGHYRDRPEIVAAHSSPVMVELAGSPFASAADALTILEQIEGALAYLDTVGTRAETADYKRMRLILTAAHRDLHNRMHRMGRYHEHSPTQDHPEHH
ncbi:MAG TPA: CehA/McbA family metallohydrolase [Phycisphaerae bacterium]|nr:CehA/McbA family metallohydrolase [Phycisphaerae bacterium]